MDIAFELHLGDLALIKSPWRTQGCGLNAHVHTIYIYIRICAHMLTVYRAIKDLKDCYAYFAECDHCVFVIVKAAASSGSYCIQKQPVMSSESRVADCSIRERQTVCVQPTNSSANSKFTAPGLKFNKTPQRPGPANSTGQLILC